MEGKAWFDVRHCPSCPFRVTGRHASVQVLGTRFQVDELRTDSVTEVYVSSGKVLFTAQDADSGVILTRGMQARLPFGERTAQVAASDMPNPAAWATGTFIYNATPLPEVLEELSSYYGVRLSTRYQGKTLTAEFGTSDLDEIISLIEKSLDIRIEKEVMP